MTKQSTNADDIYFPEMFDLPTPQKNAVLITGGARRLGRAIAVDLAAAGWPVVIHYNGSEDAALQAKHAIERDGGCAAIVQADLSIEDDVRCLIERSENLLGPVGVLINNASVFEWDDASSATAQSFALHMDIHLKAPLILCQQFAERLPNTAGGIIVNVIDSRVLNPTPRHLTYTLSKTGLWTLTRALAEEFAPRVRVNAIGPGPILPEKGQAVEEFRARCTRLPLQRPASLSEVCDSVRFLIAQRAITGQMITLDGGDHVIRQSKRATQFTKQLAYVI